jgi:hypothetical protein
MIFPFSRGNLPIDQQVDCFVAKNLLLAMTFLSSYEIYF